MMCSAYDYWKDFKEYIFPFNFYLKIINVYIDHCVYSVDSLVMFSATSTFLSMY